MVIINPIIMVIINPIIMVIINPIIEILNIFWLVNVFLILFFKLHYYSISNLFFPLDLILINIILIYR